MGVIVSAVVIPPMVRTRPIEIESIPRLLAAKRGTSVVLTPVRRRNVVNTANVTRRNEGLERTCRMSRKISLGSKAEDTFPELANLGSVNVGITARPVIIA